MLRRSCLQAWPVEAWRSSARDENKHLHRCFGPRRSLGCMLGIFFIRLAGVEDDFARTVMVLVGAGIGFFAVAAVGGEKAIVRFFGVDLQDVP